MDIAATQQSMSAAMSDAQQAKALTAEAAAKQSENRTIVLQLSGTVAALMKQTQYVNAALAKTVDVATSLTQTWATYYRMQAKLAEDAINAIGALSAGATTTILDTMEATASTAKAMADAAQTNLDAIAANVSKVVQLSSGVMDLAKQLGPSAASGIAAAKSSAKATIKYCETQAAVAQAGAQTALNTAEVGLTLAMSMSAATQETLRSVQQALTQVASNAEKIATGTINAANLVTEAVRGATPALGNITNIYLQGQISALRVVNELQPAAQAALDEATANISASLQIANSVMATAQAVVNRASNISLKFDQIANSIVAKLGV